VSVVLYHVIVHTDMIIIVQTSHIWVLGRWLRRVTWLPSQADVATLQHVISQFISYAVDPNPVEADTSGGQGVPCV
jgi:hypothetical protein